MCESKALLPRTAHAQRGVIGPGDRRLCMRLALHVHYRPFSVTSEESLRDSEPPLNGYPSTKGQETS